MLFCSESLLPFGALPLAHSVNRKTENTTLLEIPPYLLEYLRACLKGAWEYLGLGRNPIIEIITSASCGEQEHEDCNSFTR